MESNLCAVLAAHMEVACKHAMPSARIRNDYIQLKRARQLSRLELTLRRISGGRRRVFALEAEGSTRSD